MQAATFREKTQAPHMVRQAFGNDARASLREDFGLVVRQTADFNPDNAADVEEVLQLLLEALREGRMSDELRAEFDMRLIAVGVEVAADEEDSPEPAEGKPESDAGQDAVEAPMSQADELPAIEEEDDFDELGLPGVEIPHLERGPLASGILMMEAMLTEAKAGYITGQIDVLEEAINEEFSQHERVLMIDAASKWQDAAGLPDVPAAYQALVVFRATQASREG